jgi:hypothetical protein
MGLQRSERFFQTKRIQNNLVEGNGGKDYDDEWIQYRKKDFGQRRT